MKYLKLAEAALLIVAVIVLGIPAARTPVLSWLLVVLLGVVTLPGTWHAYRAGQLRMTFGQLYRTAGNRPRGSLLGLLAPVAGMAALVVAATSL